MPEPRTEPGNRRCPCGAGHPGYLGHDPACKNVTEADRAAASAAKLPARDEAGPATARCVDLFCDRVGKFAVFGGRRICPAEHAGPPIEITAERHEAIAGYVLADAEPAHPLECAGLHGGCPDCRDLYLLGLRTVNGGREPAVGVCLVCGHKHWPWEAHASPYPYPQAQSACLHAGCHPGRCVYGPDQERARLAGLRAVEIPLTDLRIDEFSDAAPAPLTTFTLRVTHLPTGTVVTSVSYQGAQRLRTRDRLLAELGARLRGSDPEATPR